MKTTTAADSAARRGVLVWDAPVRVFHWLLVFSFIGAYLSAESESWRWLHVTLGYTVAGLVVLRLLWGLVGTRHARFSSFVRGPAAALRYLATLRRGRHEHHVGHNPAGALAVLALLALALLVCATGWAVLTERGGHAMEEVHEGAANAMLALVGVHVAAVLATSWLHREHLVGAMIHGRKPGRPEDGLQRARTGVAVLLVVAVLGFWGLQWHSAGNGGAAGTGRAAAEHAQDHDDD